MAWCVVTTDPSNGLFEIPENNKLLHEIIGGLMENGRPQNLEPEKDTKGLTRGVLAKLRRVRRGQSYQRLRCYAEMFTPASGQGNILGRERLCRILFGVLVVAASFPSPPWSHTLPIVAREDRHFPALDFPWLAPDCFQNANGTIIITRKVVPCPIQFSGTHCSLLKLLGPNKFPGSWKHTEQMPCQFGVELCRVLLVI